MFDSLRPPGYSGRKIMSTRALTPANQITLLRLAFVPIFAILVISQKYRFALAVLAAAALSDIVDGTVARLLKQETPLGMALDPIADKILMITAYLTLSFRDALPWWLTILVISRDVIIVMTTLLISLVVGYRPFHPTYLGKASTVVQVATIFAALSFQARVPHVTASVVLAFVYLAAALTVASGIHYVIVVRQRYGHPAPAPAALEPAPASPQGPSEPPDESQPVSKTASHSRP
jgi:cardiolipin synthase